MGYRKINYYEIAMRNIFSPKPRMFISWRILPINRDKLYDRFNKL